jgi:integrase
MKYYRNGSPFSESTHTESKTEAQRELNKRMGDVARGVPVTSKVGRVKFKELIENVCNEYQANGRRSIYYLRIRCNKHLLPFFGERRASTITPADINRYVVKRQTEEEAANGTINRELAVLQRAYTLAVQSGLLHGKPHAQKLKESNVRTGFFEREQYEAIHQHLPAYVKPVAAVAYITGWRTLSELLPLEWRQVDFNGGTLRLDPGTTKNGEGRVFSMTRNLRAVLLEQRARTEDLQRKLGVLIPCVFHNDGKPFKSYRKSWKTACRKAGLPGRIPHDFRRTAVRNLVRAGVPEAVAMKMTGHKTRSVFERYNIVSQGDLNDAARKLDELDMVTKTVTNGDSFAESIR